MSLEDKTEEGEMLRAKSVQTAMLSRRYGLNEETLEEYQERVNDTLREAEGLGWDVLEVQNSFDRHGEFATEGIYTVIVYGERQDNKIEEKAEESEGTTSS